LDALETAGSSTGVHGAVTSRDVRGNMTHVERHVPLAAAADPAVRPLVLGPLVLVGLRREWR
jgi:hypothetical protein